VIEGVGPGRAGRPGRERGPRERGPRDGLASGRSASVGRASGRASARAVPSRTSGRGTPGVRRAVGPWGGVGDWSTGSSNEQREAAASLHLVHSMDQVANLVHPLDRTPPFWGFRWSAGPLDGPRSGDKDRLSRRHKRGA
jgi:hypothetical protein